MMWAIVASVSVGLLLPVQTGINARLRLRVGHPITAAFCSFGVGTLVLLMYATLTGVRWPGLDTLATTQWWYWTGGALGALYVATVIVIAPKLGAATLVSTVITGQVISSLIQDNFGIFGYAVHELTFGRLAGAALLIGGVFVIRRPATRTVANAVAAVEPFVFLLIAAGLLSGAAQSCQAGMNSTLARHVGQPTYASLVSFLVGTTILIVICVIVRVPRPKLGELRQTRWWNWVGGLIGVCFVTTTTLTAPLLGAATLTGLLVAGQMSASLALDHFGLLGFRQERIHLLRLVGVALLLGGVILTGFF